MSFSMFFLLLISDAILPNAVFPFNVFTFTVFPCAVFRLPYLHKSSLFQRLSQTLKRISLYQQNYFCPKYVKKKPMETWLTHPPKIAPNPSPLNIQFCEKKFFNLAQEQHQHKQRHYHHDYHLCVLIIIVIIIDYHYHYHWLSWLLSLIIIIIITCVLMFLFVNDVVLSAVCSSPRLMVIDDYWLLIIDDHR